MIRTIIVDDEKLARENLRALLGNIAPEVQIIGEANSVETAIDLIWNSNVDLVFLDIDLTDGSGFNVLEKVESNKFHVIFTTAFSEFALQAFRVNAVDYILKPIDRKELLTALQRVKERTLVTAGPQSQETNETHKLAINEGDGVRFVSVKDIMRCKSDDNYTEVFLDDGKRIVSSKTLKEYQKTLEPLGFVRVHQSHLVNLKKIAKVARQDGFFIVMENTDLIPVSRRKKDELFDRLKEIQI